MANLYLKKLESKRKTLWATCRLKGLAKHTPERLPIVEIDRLVAEHKARRMPKSNALGMRAGDFWSEKRTASHLPCTYCCTL